MKTLKLEFVEFIPEVLSEETLYISMKYKAARHKCACGCGSIVITPLSPNHWKLKYDGKSISLRPSIGNFGFPCRSHYWITNNNVIWEEPWSDEEVFETIRAREVEHKPISQNTQIEKKDIFSRLKKTVFGFFR
jgi:hypothetical protein